MTPATRARRGTCRRRVVLVAPVLLACGGFTASAPDEVVGSNRREAKPLPTAVLSAAPPLAGAEASAASPDSPKPAPPARRLAIASWNLRRLGEGDDRDEAAVARVLERFDLVALQEVMTRESITSLLARLPGWTALLTDSPLPRDGSPHREYYAFLYREDRLLPLLNTTVPDPDDAFVRDPFLGCFRTRGHTAELCLLTIHVTYGDRVEPRKAEIRALGAALRWAQQTREDEGDWVVLGDFNRVVDDGDADTDPEEEWRALLDRQGLERPMELAGRELPTTLGASDWSQPYDHVFVSAALGDALVDAGRIDIVDELCDGDFARCRSALSDHAPVYVVVEVPR